MKKIGFFGLAVAAILIGDVTLDPSTGFETVSRKSFEPLGSGGVQLEVGGSHAGGAGNLLALGDHVIATGGVEGYVGCCGGGVVLPIFEFVPQPNDNDKSVNKSTNRGSRRKERCRPNSSIHQPPQIPCPYARIWIGSGEPFV